MKRTLKSTIMAGAVALAGAAYVPVSANDTTPVLHPTDEACITYDHSGQMQSGTSTRCHRDYAYETYEIQNLTMGFGGFTQAQNQHNITIGEWIYAINLDTNTGTKTENPMYNGMVSALDDTSPAEMMDA